MNVSGIRGLTLAAGLAVSSIGLAGCGINEIITTEKLEDAVKATNVLTKDEFQSFRDSVGKLNYSEPLNIRIWTNKLIEVKDLQLKKAIDSTANATRSICTENIKNAIRVLKK